MSATEIRQEINQYLDRLSSDRLQLVADFLAYLADKESEEATIAEGCLANWRTIRSDVWSCFIR